MTCFFPLTAWRSRAPEDHSPGKAPRLVFDKAKGYPGTELKIACGQCAGCRLDRARSWAIRAIHEASLHESNCFLTLTYSDEALPYSSYVDDLGSSFVLPTLLPRDGTLFLKRLRKKYGAGIRYLFCGEYGSDYSRPHYHALLFNWRPDDLSVYGKSGDNIVYTSAQLQSLWPHGFSTVGDLSFDSACYTARYVLKKVTGEKADEHYQGREPEYLRSSRRPGLARGWYEQWTSDVYDYDHVVVRDKFIARPPQYYDRLFEQNHPERFQEIKKSRKSRVVERSPEELQRLRQFAAEKQSRISGSI